ncbi:MAG: hypothetical protein KAS78_01085, partial [Candidatus Pacebacteria bacterium]|nr:hypothetical protein [Candidatus Paceibacterota bacterium]
MSKKTSKIFLILFIAIITTSFAGCLNLFPSNSSEEKIPFENERNDHQGVFKTIDGGKTWEHKIKMSIKEEKDGENEESEQENQINEDKNDFIETEETILDKSKISSMKMDPQNNQVLYLGTVNNGLYKSENGSDSWVKINDENKILDDQSTIFSIAIENGNSNIVYVATLNRNRGELLKSENGGKTWVLSYVSSEPGKQINYVQIDPLHNNTVYIGTEQGGLIKSDNRGSTWYTLSWFSLGVKDFVIDFQDNRGIIVKTTNKIYKSVVENNLETFQSLGGKEKEIFEHAEGNKWMILNKLMNISLSMKINHSQISSMTIDNKNPLVIYITYKNLILVTRDGGYVWQKMNTITPALTVVGTAPQVKQIGMINDIIYYGAGNA